MKINPTILLLKVTNAKNVSIAGCSIYHSVLQTGAIKHLLNPLWTIIINIHHCWWKQNRSISVTPTNAILFSFNNLLHSHSSLPSLFWTFCCLLEFNKWYQSSAWPASEQNFIKMLVCWLSLLSFLMDVVMHFFWYPGPQILAIWVIMLCFKLLVPFFEIVILRHIQLNMLLLLVIFQSNLQIVKLLATSTYFYTHAFLSLWFVNLMLVTFKNLLLKLSCWVSSFLCSEWCRSQFKKCYYHFCDLSSNWWLDQF